MAWKSPPSSVFLSFTKRTLTGRPASIAVICEANEQAIGEANSSIASSLFICDTVQKYEGRDSVKDFYAKQYKNTER